MIGANFASCTHLPDESQPRSLADLADLADSQAWQRIISRGENKEYLTIEGLDAFRKATVELLLGAGHPAIKEVRAPGAASRLCRPGPAARLRAPAAGG